MSPIEVLTAFTNFALQEYGVDLTDDVQTFIPARQDIITGSPTVQEVLDALDDHSSKDLSAVTRGYLDDNPTEATAGGFAEMVSVSSGSSAGGGTDEIAVTKTLKDGDVAHIEAVIEGEDSVTGDRALYLRDWSVKKAGGTVSALAGVGWFARHTAEEDSTWPGPTALVDVGGQAGVRVGGDPTNTTNWAIRAKINRKR